MAESTQELISSRDKRQLWLGAWAVVAFVGMVPHPSQLLMAPFFPIGLLALLPGGDEKTITAWMQGFPCVLGWVVYALFSAMLFRIRKRDAFFLFYALFCIILALNMVGCKKAFEAAAGIH